MLESLNDEVSAGKVAIIANRSHSLLRQSLHKKITSSGIQWFEHDAVDYTSAENKLGKALGLNKALRPVPDLSSAKRVLSLDNDFLGNREVNELSNTRAFMSGRKVLKAADAKRMNRLYIAESDLSRTGGVADHRIRVESSQMIGFASLVASELFSRLGRSDQALKKHLKSLSSFTQDQKEWVAEAVADLLSNPKKSVILAGGHLPAEVQLLAYEMNRLLGAIGSTINYIEVGASADSIYSLASKINDGSVERLFILGGNPVYQTKGFINWEDLSKKLKFVARLGGSIDESSQIANYHLGQSHYLESWDLGITWDQTSIVPVQPLIAPLFDTISEASLLSHLVGEEKEDHSLVKNLHSQFSNGGDFSDFLRLGVLATKPVPFTSLDATKAILSIKPGKVKSSKLTEDNLEVVIIPDFHAHDGQYANNGWMQECPDPISKLTWDNALLISPVLANILESKHPGLGLLPKPTMLNKNGQIAPDAAQFDGGKQKAPVVTVKVGEKSITAPLYVQPGLADFTLVATLGHGRTNVGRVGQGTGYDVTPLLSSDSLVISGVSIEPTGDFEILANVQEHWSMEGRAIVREANVDEYTSDTGFASKMGAESHSPPMWGKDQDKSLQEKATTTPVVILLTSIQIIPTKNQMFLEFINGV